MIESKTNILFYKFSIYLFWLVAIFDPVNSIFGSRYIPIVIVVVMVVFKIFLSRREIKFTRIYVSVYFLFVIFIPIYGFYISLARGGMNGDFIDTSYFAASVYFACSLIYFLNEDVDQILEIIIFTLRVLCLIILLTFIFLKFNLSLNSIYCFVEGGVAFIGQRRYGGVDFPYIYFIASPMLVLLLSFDTWNFIKHPTARRLFLLLMPVLALFLSGTRMQIIISIIGFPFICLWKKYREKSIFILSFALLFVILILLVTKNKIILDMLSIGNSSNSLKIGYLNSYLDLLKDPVTLIFGQGFNAHVWSKEFASIIYGNASKTELTYFEYIRIFGLTGTAIFALIIFGLISQVRKIPYLYQWIAPCLILYLAISTLNPYLFSSNGMLIFGLCAALISKKIENKQH